MTKFKRIKVGQYELEESFTGEGFYVCKGGKPLNYICPSDFQQLLDDLATRVETSREEARNEHSYSTSADSDWQQELGV